MINSSMTAREVAIELPQSTRLFERLKIDYCCGGNELEHMVVDEKVNSAQLVSVTRIDQAQLI
jgi:iron-sulfur cluster repair protein YtfE (RIC family)